MPTLTSDRTRTAAVQALFDGLQQFSRALRSRSGDWAHAVRDLSRADLVTLGIVARQGSIRSGQVAQTLGVDPSVVSRQLAALERLGLVARCADPADRRAELISVTEAGHHQLRAARAAMCEALGARVDDWDADAILRAAAVLQDLSGVLRDAPHTDDTGDSTHHTGTLTTEDSKDTHA